MEVFNFQDFINKVSLTEWSIANRKIKPFFPFHHVGIRPLMWANSFEYHVLLECHVFLESKMRHIFDIDAVADRDFDNQNKNRISICCLILRWKQIHVFGFIKHRIVFVEFNSHVRCRVWFLYQEMCHISCSCEIFSSWINCTGFLFTWC